MGKKMPEMKRSVILIFKIGTDHYHLFQLMGWKVRTDHVLKVEDGQLVCNCAISRFEPTCPHRQAVQAVCKQWFYGLNDHRTAESPITWQEGTPKQFVVVLADLGAGLGVMELSAVHPEVGDLSLWSLLFLITEPEPSEDIKNASGFLNPKRIFEECSESLAQGVSVVDDRVLQAGKAVAPLKASGVVVEMDYDETLIEKPEVPPKTVGSLNGKPPWKTVKRPDPKVFFVKPDIWQQLLYTMHEGGNTLITGPSGCGKSTIGYIAAKALGLGLAAFNMGATSEPRTTLIGNTHFDKEKGTWFQESRFVRMVRQQRGCLLLDEITRAERGAFNILLPLMDHQGYLALDEHEDAPVIKKGENVSFIATANIGMEYTGTDAMDKALKDRCDTTIDLGFPPVEFEIKILISRCPGLRAGDASKLVRIATRQREMTVNDAEFVEQISTRMLLAAGKRIGAGMSFKVAVEFCLENQFTAEGGDASERTRVRQIVQKGVA